MRYIGRMDSGSGDAPGHCAGGPVAILFSDNQKERVGIGSGKERRARSRVAVESPPATGP
jgi:hypothetical protein